MGTKNASMVPVLLYAALLLHASAPPADAQPPPRPAVAQSFGWKGQDFLLDGKPFVIRSGEMHYPRVPRAYWRDRMRKARAMGLNTITTYVFWNLHEPKRGDFDFSGNLDVAEFVKAAQAEGLFVIVRPGPYVCTEWDLGGIPAWLLAEPDLKVRTADRRFLEASRRYMAEVGRRLAPLQAGRGGNILMVQVENEYGSFGDDKAYLQSVKKSIEDAGFSFPLFTSDGPGATTLKNGTLPGVLSVINFGVDAKQGSKSVARHFESFAAFRPSEPRMVGEYWVGWFDHWGEKRHTVDAAPVAESVRWMLSQGISFNLYMFHGGTSFGFMNGANSSRDQPYQPDTSSYDYDAPLDEAGKPTPKYHAVRDAIKAHLPAGETLPEIPAGPDTIEVPAFDLEETADVFGLLGKATTAPKPLPMEALGQNYGFVLYRTKLDRDGQGELRIDGVRDYAHVFVDGRLVGRLDRRLKENALPLDAKAGARLDILVENGGRVNFGRDFNLDRKGIVGDVSIAGRVLEGWQMYSLPMDDLSRLRFAKGRASAPGIPAFHRGVFTLAVAGDTYLDTTSWGKGHVWVNGHHLGRFWRIGPQQTLFVPATWLRKGTNEVIVLEVEKPSRTSLRGAKSQIFETPALPTTAPAPQPQAASAALAPGTYVPQRVYDTRARAFADFETMVADLARADVVFVGEQHDDPNTHRLELAVLEGLKRRGLRPTLSLEMFERDTQAVLDRYLAGTASEQEFLGTSRPWPRYATDYRPLVELAKSSGWPVIASNVPRRYAAEVAKAGLSALDRLNGAERVQAARTFQCPNDAYFERFVATMTGHPGPEASQTDAAAEETRARNERYYLAQCVKDETMAESIAAAAFSGGSRPIVHMNGSFHSDYRLGTAERTARRLPGRRVAVVSILPVTDLDTLAPSGDDLTRADYLVFTVK